MPDHESSRRNFFQKLIGIGTLAVIPVKVVDTPIADRMKYKGYELIWTGWKQMPDQDTSVGQWCALRKNNKGEIQGFGFYASYPGGQGIYYPGQMFNCCIMHDQLPVNYITPDETREQNRLEALQRVMKEIDTYGQSED